MDQISEKLDDINNTLKQMLAIMPRPAGKLQKILDTILLFVGIFGIIFIIDTVRNWIIGG